MFCLGTDLSLYYVCISKNQIKMTKFERLQGSVVAWAHNKGIFGAATPQNQMTKTIEEVMETQMAIMAQQMGMSQFVNAKGKTVDTRAEIEDGIGDVLVTLIIQCEMQGIDPLEALEGAYNIISKRTGKMVGGVFVKDDV